MNENFESAVVVERVLSQLENGCIFTGRQEDGSIIRVKFAGKDTQPLPGDIFMVKGLLSNYRDRFGRVVHQVNSKRMSRSIIEGTLLGPWLSRLPNIGAMRAQRLMDTYGHDLAEVLGDVGRMAEVAGVIEPNKPALATKIAAQVYTAVAVESGTYKLRAAEVEFLTFLEKIGIKESHVADQLWRFMAGVDAVDRLCRNPYMPASIMDWKLVDGVGQRLIRSRSKGLDLNSHPARLMGALSSVWREILSEGNTAGTEESIAEMLATRGVDAKSTLQLAEKNNFLKRKGPFLRVPGAAWLEDQITSALGKMESRVPSVPVPTGETLISTVCKAESSVGLRLTEEQRTAVMKLLTLPVAVLQGGAGVGKTTVMKVFAKAWESIGGDVVMGALAGKAALMLSCGASSPNCPRTAYTIARLIGMLERQQVRVINSEKNRNPSDVTFTEKTLLVLDEAGMLDTPSLHKLLGLLPEGARILFAGDEGQLPPVGIGKVFHDLVTEDFRVARLTKVLRQAENSEIPRIAALIRQGKAPLLTTWNNQPKGVYLVRATDLKKVQRKLRGKIELMVVAAKKVTVTNINETEASVEQRDKPTRRLGPFATVAVGDPVVVTRNRYQEGLFNGLLGMVTSIDGPEAMVLWDGEPEQRSLAREAEGDIELAYAITCHKAQGSSAHSVLVVVENSRLVTREWLYTAITRGRELVLFVGDNTALEIAIGRRTVRITGFALPLSNPSVFAVKAL